MRGRLVPLVVCIVLLGGVAAVALGQVGGPSPARAAAVRAAGAFEISNSVAGEPIFAAAKLAPGGAAKGRVTIEDSGSVPVALSEQNPLQSASTTVAYSWVAEEATGGAEGGETPEEEPPAEEDPKGGSPIGAPGGTGGSENRGTESGVESGLAGVGASLELTVPRILPRLTGGGLVTYIDCDASCRIFVRGRLRASAHGRHRTAKIRFSLNRPYTPGSKKMRIPVPRGIRKWLRRMSPPKHLKAKLRFIAVGTAGGRDVVKKKIRLRARHH